MEIERKERKKLKEKERKERLKAEGKLLSAKQKADRARAQAMLDALKAQGLEMPNAGEKRAPRPGTRVRTKAKQQTSLEQGELCIMYFGFWVRPQCLLEMFQSYSKF